MNSNHTLALFGVLLGALFFGQVLIPQFLIFLFPWLTAYLSQGYVAFGFFNITLIGFFFTAVITLPFLIYFVRASHSAQQELEAH